uniref:type IX secretion system sortase PorU n=1 Tax=Adhaeribacter soli TaxID=2607655 RepID=UPI0017823961|nr:type IX secretion system sortase PorU [Adhaeribacter soli]
MSTAFAQGSGQATLTWQGTTPVKIPGKAAVNIPVFSGSEIKPEELLPYYTLRIPGAEISDFRLKNPVYKPFTPEEAKSFPKDKLKASPEIVTKAGIANGKTISFVTFAPIRLNPQSGQVEKLESFEYSYATTNNQRKRSGSRRSYKQNSVLSTGDWFKIGVTQSGIHKIDRTTLQNIGINPQGLDPRRIQVYGNGIGMLPQANAAFRHDDLVQNAIMVAGENDGSFDNDDYILFYAQGPHTWELNPNKDGFQHKLNIYTDTTYYFITVGQQPGLRVNSATVSGTPTKTITTFKERLFHESDRVNLLTSGREWYGEEFNSNSLSKEFTFPISDLVPNSNVSLTSSVLGISAVSEGLIGSRFTVNLNNVALGTQAMAGHGGGSYHNAGVPNVRTFTPSLNTIPYNNAELKVALNFDQMGQASTTGHLNFLEINADRQLKLYSSPILGLQTNFRSLENIATNAFSTFQVANVNGNAAEVWDVSNPTQPMRQNVSFANGNATFIAKTDTVREFTVFSGSGFPAPQSFGRVANQNLHSLNLDGKLDMVIVAHPKFWNQAHRLANHRMQHDRLKVAVVSPNQVYNEFSSGAQDVSAIRDLMKMVYDRRNAMNTKTNDSTIYLLLFGDASYDYKSKFADARLNRTQNNKNFVPVYESYESLNATWTFSSEDYFGLLDDTEGAWYENNFNRIELMDLGVGRIPAHTPGDADVMVSKIINYSNPDHFGKWRNRVTFVADDEDTNQHLRDSEEISGTVENKYPDYNVHKIYLDMFRQVPVPNGKRSPDCAAEFDRAVEQGSLITNYMGHGGETGLAAEQILTIGQINSWKNSANPTFMVTATCEFGRYDDPRRNSAAEFALLNPNGGAVGLVTTTRPVYVNSNKTLNASLIKCILEPINGRMPRLGDVIQNTKNTSIDGVFNRNFSLLCDPSMRLAYPSEKISVTSVQEKPAGTSTDTLKALSTITLNGTVTDQQNNPLTNFNGQVNITVFEKKTLVRTLGDNGSIPTNIPVRESIIYEGVATAKNGIFSSTFIVPKDINYNVGLGKISMYAAGNNTDAHGSKNDIYVGGSSSNIPLDTVPPVIKLFMDNESFVFGGLTGNNSMLISHLSDSSGINTAGLGIGHEITATLDGNKENVKVLNEYYTADLDNFRSGKVRYMFKNLTPGPHELRIKAWDTHNNSAEKRIEFIVANSETFAIDHILNYPNPFSTNTTFHFDHNRAGEDLDIQIQIFTVSGKLVRTLNAFSLGSKPHVAEISWNGRDEYNDVLAKGVYVYKLSVRSAKDGSKVSKYEKLVILN